MDALWPFYLFMTLAGVIPLLVVWWLSRHIQLFWMRQLPRALTFALAFTPGFAGGGGPCGVVIPVPAILLLFGTGADRLPLDRIFIVVIAPMVFCFLVF
ncbi:MAG TPA: hypothetical protein VMH87_15645 [Pseudomonadales bacterium]|nr:hypothetical protein [Pseudomonadales bacterium]